MWFAGRRLRFALVLKRCSHAWTIYPMPLRWCFVGMESRWPRYLRWKRRRAIHRCQLGSDFPHSRKRGIKGLIHATVRFNSTPAIATTGEWPQHLFWRSVKGSMSWSHVVNLDLSVTQKFFNFNILRRCLHIRMRKLIISWSFLLLRNSILSNS
jgi:hypothetical protein